ncbi:MAG: GNAT family N-acetyltransferase [Puniceicoccales bacterium]|jgi:RimJ/RimL family protein N-acetyltransferase|nr:GNAT family N-acetyltransferase [Puniceicoccales bacterium]
MSRHKVIETPRLRLRPLEFSDFDRIVEFMGQREVTDFLLYFTYPIIPEQVQEWLKNVIEAKPEHCAYWAIVEKSHDELIGIISLTMDPYNHRTEMGYWLDKDCWGQGYMTEVAWRVIEYVFEDLKLHRIDLTHMVANTRSQRVAQKLGFQLEGCWREGHFKDRSYKDVKIYGMLEVDFFRARRKREREKNQPAKSA